jgi:MFS superfamily sulfate permease-like transporter
LEWQTLPARSPVAWLLQDRLRRSALNVSSGAKTAYASLFCGTVILGFAYFISKWVALVPLACLSMLVILVEIELANFSAIKLILKSGTQDRVVFLSTFRDRTFGTP